MNSEQSRAEKLAQQYEGRFTLINHPLVVHKMALLRDKSTPAGVFRQLVRELTLLEAYEATKHLETHQTTIETPITQTVGTVISNQEPVVVPILRSGLSMLDAMLELIPNAPVAHLGMARDEITHQAKLYYAKMPPMLAERQAIVIDPMLATGGSLTMAIDLLRERGVKDMVAMVILACPEGVEAVLKAEKHIQLFACALDEGLTPEAFITPGLGDAGDRMYQTLDTPVEGTAATAAAQV